MMTETQIMGLLLCIFMNLLAIVVVIGCLTIWLYYGTAIKEWWESYLVLTDDTGDSM